MEVTKGYKQTEVGVIPEDWDILQLSELGKFKNGINKSSEAFGHGSPFVNLMDVFGVSSIAYSDSLGLVDTNNAEQQTYDLRKGDVIFIRSSVKPSGVGLTAVVEEDLPKTVYSGFLIRFRDSGTLNSGFKRHCFYEEGFRGRVIAASSVSANTNINQDNLKRLLIALPPTKAEQTAIAAALNGADDLIQSIEKLIAKKRNIKQGAMQELLKPKQGWVNKTLGEIGSITGAGVDKKINENEMPVRLVNYLDVFHRDFIYSNELTHWVTAPASKAKKCAVQKGDIFFTPSSEMRFDIAISAVAMEDIPDAAYSYHLVRLRLFEDWDLTFRTYIFKTKYFLDQAETVCEGSGKRYVITLPKFRGMKIYFPPIKEEQIRIATILSDMDAEITALETKLVKYKQVKQGMMQELLTGKTRLV